MRFDLITTSSSNIVVLHGTAVLTNLDIIISRLCDSCTSRSINVWQNQMISDDGCTSNLVEAPNQRSGIHSMAEGSQRSRHTPCICTISEVSV